MAEPTLTEVFGAGATQTATTITILKADLDITASATNKAEGLAAAIFKKMSGNLTKTAFDGDADRSVYIEPSYETIGSRTIGTTTSQLLQSFWSIVFAKPQATAGITPNDY